MITVSPMWDEPSTAHEARRRQVVGARDKQEHFARMRGELSALESVAENATDLEVLARASGLELESYAVEHSFLANFIVAAPADEIRPFGWFGMARCISQFGLRLPRRSAFVCHACIDEDMANKRFSWFRRAHQIVGAEYCLKHRCGLHQVIAERPFEQSPNCWRDDGLLGEGSLYCENSTPYAFICRHVSIAMALLGRDRPVPCEHLNRRLAEEARRLDVGGARTKGQTLLSDRVLDVAGEDWLFRHFPHFVMKTRGLAFREIDNVLKRRDTAAPGELYVLALAALFDSADAALHMVVLADSDASAEVTLREKV